MDEKDVRITADNLTYSAYQSTMDLLIENNSDQDLSVISGSIGFRVKTSDYQDYLTIDPVKIKFPLRRPMIFQRIPTGRQFQMEPLKR